jgi:hypothetical protein
LAEAQGYRHFGTARLKEPSAPQTFTLSFHQSTQLTGIVAKGDFAVTGGTCAESRSYTAGDACTVEMIFTPRGPGHRTGKLVVNHTASATPFVVPAGGEGTGPAVSITPAYMGPVDTILTGNAVPLELLCNDQIAIDGGDNLYIPDCKLGSIYFLDSTFQQDSVLGNLSTPSGVATDPMGNVYVAENGDGVVGVEYTDGSWHHILDPQGGQSSLCTFAGPCLDTVDGKHLNFSANPFQLAIDPTGNLYVDGYYGGEYYGILSPQTALYPGSGGGAPFNFDFWDLATPWSHVTTTQTLGADASGNFYTTNNVSQRTANAVGENTECFIYGQNPAYSNQQKGGKFWVVAGTRFCGYSGDGGLATGAEISSQQSGFAWDAAGNFYFTDTGNNVIRRIDAQTGIIRTIAGTGKAGTGGPSYLAQSTTTALDNPTGLAVDSHGDVFFTSNASSNSMSLYEILGDSGFYYFPGQVAGTSSQAEPIVVTNTGNAPLIFTNIGFSPGNKAFAIDPLTTTCNLAVGLAAGASCEISVIFTPPAAAIQYESQIVLADNAIGYQVIELAGIGVTPGKPVLSPPSLSFGDQAVATTSAAQKLTLTNGGGGSLQIVSYPNTVGEFAVSGTTCELYLAPAASCTFSIVFSPTAVGLSAPAFTVQSSNGSASSGLLGEGATAAASMQFAPQSLTFPSTAVGVASSPIKAVLNNTGIPTITFTKVSIGGANSGDFSQTNYCIGSLLTGDGCDVIVTFKPTAGGTRTATLTTTNSASLTTSMTLTGTATAAGVKPAVTLASKVNPAPSGQSVVLTSRVVSATSPQATGEVQLKQGSTVLSTAKLAGGAVTFNLSNLSAGTYELTADYLGDKLHAAAESPVIKQVVAPGTAERGND